RTARPVKAKPCTPLDIGPDGPKPMMASLSAIVDSATIAAFSLDWTPVVVPAVRWALMAGPFCAVPLCTTPVCSVDQLLVLPTSTCVPGPAAPADGVATTVHTTAAPAPAAAHRNHARRLVASTSPAGSASSSLAIVI